MESIYAQHWRYLRRGRRLHVAIAASLLVHAAVFAAVGLRDHRPPPPPIPLVYEVSFVAPPTPDPKPEPVKQPPPPPPPKKEEPKPEPKKEEPKKEEPKPKPKPKPEPKKVAEKKPEPKKETPKPEKKPDPPKPPPPKELPQPEVVAKAPPPETGIKREMLPPMLNAWGRQVQRKVEKYWVQPGGIRLDADESSVQISFWVGRDGMLLTQPVVESKNANAALAASGVQAVISAQPLPPLPIEFTEDRAHVYYMFSMMNPMEPAGGTL
jgi:outer membrane biosynthesis protein TonB